MSAGGPAGTRPSPNIWGRPDVYELENEGIDRAGRVEAAMRRRHDWSGGHVLDIGCGAGYHLPRFAADAARVIGVEPHPPLLALARQRVRGLAGVEVREGVAQELPVADASIDVAHARWAYFFGPGCEPGLDELDRVMRPEGTAFIVDIDATASTFGAWFRRARPAYDPLAVRRFWARHGWTREPLLLAWEHDSRVDFESVVRIEFAPHEADRILAGHPGTSVDYAVDLWWRDF